MYAKEFAADAASAALSAAVPTAGHAFGSSARLEPMHLPESALRVSLSDLTSISVSQPTSTATKKPKYSSSSPKRTSPRVILSSSNEPRFQAMTSEVGPDDPCYNFTIGNKHLKEFYSPNFPNFYPNDTECERVIQGKLSEAKSALTGPF